MLGHAGIWLSVEVYSEETVNGLDPDVGAKTGRDRNVIDC